VIDFPGGNEVTRVIDKRSGNESSSANPIKGLSMYRVRQHYSKNEQLEVGLNRVKKENPDWVLMQVTPQTGPNPSWVSLWRVRDEQLVQRDLRRDAAREKAATSAEDYNPDMIRLINAMKEDLVSHQELALAAGLRDIVLLVKKGLKLQTTEEYLRR